MMVLVVEGRGKILGTWTLQAVFWRHSATKSPSGVNLLFHLVTWTALEPNLKLEIKGRSPHIPHTCHDRKPAGPYTYSTTVIPSVLGT